MTRTSTEYYRENRRTRRVVYRCSCCTYETTGSKIQLTNHINARHTPEIQRPYQCHLCTRGFAQKAHLKNHLVRQHDIPEGVKRKISTVAYIIKHGREKPKSLKTKARYIFYRDHSLIKSRMVKEKSYEYLPGVFLKLHDLHYDAKKQFITLATYRLYEPVRKQ